MPESHSRQTLFYQAVSAIIPRFCSFLRKDTPKKIKLSDHLLIARTTTRTVALVVDAVHEVIERTDGDVVIPETIVPGMEYVKGVVKLDDGMVFIHDLNGFLSLEEEQVLEAALEPENHD